MKTQKLVDLDVTEISLLFKPNNPAVPQARILVAKGRSFLEDPATLDILRRLNAVVEGLKADQLAKEAAATQARKQLPQRVRVRSFDAFEDIERAERARAAQGQRRSDFYAACDESSKPLIDPATGKAFRQIGSDFGK